MANPARVWLRFLRYRGFPFEETSLFHGPQDRLAAGDHRVAGQQLSTGTSCGSWGNIRFAGRCWVADSPWRCSPSARRSSVGTCWSALDLPFRLADAFRLSFVGYLLNFVAFGSVGGDLFKAVFLAREQPGRRTEAVATVFLDRAVGLYSLLVVASAAILFSGSSAWDAEIKTICNLTLAATAVGTAAIVVILLPGWDRSSLMKTAVSHSEDRRRRATAGQGPEGLPGKAGHAGAGGGGESGRARGLRHLAVLGGRRHLSSASDADRPFHHRPAVADRRGFAVAPAGLGTFEAAMKILYQEIPAQGGGDGFLVALVFRLITIVIAAIGVVYYWIGRREVGELLREAEHEQEEENSKRRWTVRKLE